MKRHYSCIQTATLDSLFSSSQKEKRGTYVKNSMRSVMLPFQHSKHKSAKKLLEHAEKQRLNLSLNPYRVLHSSLHNELKSQKLKQLKPTASYKKAHRQSGKVFAQDRGSFPAYSHQFSKYNDASDNNPAATSGQSSDPHLWQRDVTVGSIVEI